MDVEKVKFTAEFQSFLDANMPMIRPAGTIGRVRHAMNIGSAFRAAFKTLRIALKQEIDRWPEMIVIEIMQYRDLTDQLDHDEMDTFRLLFLRHKQAILDNMFDEDYFRTIEELTLFFIYHDIRAVWLVGALKSVIARSMARLYDQRDAGQRGIMFTLIDFLSLELSQVQRVYIRYAEYQDIALRDPAGQGTRST